MPLDLDNLQPVQSRFFSAVTQNPLLSASAKASIVDRALEGRLSLENVRHKLTTSRQQERLNDIRIEREEFALQEARRVAQERQDDMDVAGNLKGTFTDILDDPSLDNGQKHDALNRIALENAGLFSRSRTLQGVLGAAKGSLDPKLTAQGKLAQEREARIMRYNEENAARREREDLEKERRTTIKDFEDDLNGRFGTIAKADFKTKITAESLDPVPTDEFENSSDRASALGFVNKYGSVAQREMALSMTDRQLKEMVNELWLRQGQMVDAVKRGAPPESSDNVKDLAIPTG